MENKLIACPVCKKEVSSGAPRCPHCGESISAQQKEIDQAALIASEAFNKTMSFGVWLVAWTVGLGFWCALAAFFPKTISVLTVLCCSGLIFEAKEKGQLRAVKWVRMIVFYMLSFLFFAASFYL